MGNYRKFERLELGGCFTVAKSILNCDLAEVERRLGFHPHTFYFGAALFAYTTLPRIDQIKLLGYTNVPADKVKDSDIIIHQIYHQWRWKAFVPGANLEPNHVVKIKKYFDYGEDASYPPGSGVNQWQFRYDEKSNIDEKGECILLQEFDKDFYTKRLKITGKNFY